MFRTLSIEPIRIEERSKDEVRANIIVVKAKNAIVSFRFG
ncbi:uncharacterized protein LOC120445271 [Drosophila santomea]|nr:uncharacterized protein LOC120445271 [Drosophila santomea]